MLRHASVVPSALVCPLRMQVSTLDAYFTDMHWYPVSSKKTQAGGTDVFAVACTDGASGWLHSPCGTLAGRSTMATLLPFQC